jgi:hypothetical protein
MPATRNGWTYQYRYGCTRGVDRIRRWALATVIYATRARAVRVSWDSEDRLISYLYITCSYRSLQKLPILRYLEFSRFFTMSSFLWSVFQSSSRLAWCRPNNFSKFPLIQKRQTRSPVNMSTPRLQPSSSLPGRQ